MKSPVGNDVILKFFVFVEPEDGHDFEWNGWNPDEPQQSCDSVCSRCLISACKSWGHGDAIYKAGIKYTCKEYLLKGLIK